MVNLLVFLEILNHLLLQVAHHCLDNLVDNHKQSRLQLLEGLEVVHLVLAYSEELLLVAAYLEAQIHLNKHNQPQVCLEAPILVEVCLEVRINLHQ